MANQRVHEFAEKVALITDASSDVGRAAAFQLALQGAFVIAGLPAASSERSVIDELRSLGTLASSVEGDLSSSAGVDALIAEVENTFGRLDLLVNCLKSGPHSSFEQMSEEDFERSIGQNLKAAYFVTKKSLSLMSPRPKPKIVNVVWNGPSDDPVFKISQDAVIGLTRELARTLPPNFRVNCVAVKSDAGTGVTIPADDVARVITYLLSSEAKGLNGQILEAG